MEKTTHQCKLFKKVFMVWEGDDSQEKYWNQYETLEDAVSDKGDGVDVYVAEPRFLGRYKRSVNVLKVPRGKKKLKKASK